MQFEFSGLKYHVRCTKQKSFLTIVVETKLFTITLQLYPVSVRYLLWSPFVSLILLEGQPSSLRTSLRSRSLARSKFRSWRNRWWFPNSFFPTEKKSCTRKVITTLGVTLYQRKCIGCLPSLLRKKGSHYPLRENSFSSTVIVRNLYMGANVFVTFLATRILPL